MIEDPCADALRALVRAHAPLMRWLRAARACATGLDWCIGAGAVRALVWNHLHGLPAGSHAPADVDFVYFDPADLSSASETGLAARSRAAAPDAPWEVVNQARVHLWRRDGERVPPPSHRWKPASPPGLKRRPASAFRWGATTPCASCARTGCPTCMP